MSGRSINVASIDHRRVGDMKTTRDRRTLHQTVFRFSDVAFNRGLDAGTFTVRRLERLGFPTIRATGAS